MLWIDRVGNRRSWAILARYFSVENWGQAQRKIRTKKERKRRPVETDAAVEIRSQRGFPQRLGKHKTLSTVPTRPDGGSLTGFTFFERQRSTLNTHSFGPKDGEHLKQLNGKCANTKLSQQRGSPQTERLFCGSMGTTLACAQI